MTASWPDASALVADRPAHPIDRSVDRGVQLVVEVAIALMVLLVDRRDRRGRAVARRVGGPVGDVRRRLVAQVLDVRRRHRHRGHGDPVELVGHAPTHPQREQHDVVRVHEAGHQEERPLGGGVAGPASGVAVGQPGGHPLGDQRVAHQAAVGELAAVGLRPHPAREAVGPERVGVEVALDVAGQDLAARRVGRHRRAVRPQEVGVGDVPLAVVVRVVARGPEPVAERRHLLRAHPAHA